MKRSRFQTKNVAKDDLDMCYTTSFIHFIKEFRLETRCVFFVIWTYDICCYCVPSDIHNSNAVCFLYVEFNICTGYRNEFQSLHSLIDKAMMCL